MTNPSAVDNASPTSAPMTVEEQAEILAWLSRIGERDEAIVAGVLDQCRRDADARDYFLGRAAELTEPDPSAGRIARMVSKLEHDPVLAYAIETHDDADPDAAILTIAIKGKGAGELRIPKSRYDAVALLRLLDPHTTRETLQ